MHVEPSSLAYLEKCEKPAPMKLSLARAYPMAQILLILFPACLAACSDGAPSGARQGQGLERGFHLSATTGVGGGKCELEAWSAVTPPSSVMPPQAASQFIDGLIAAGCVRPALTMNPETSGSLVSFTAKAVCPEAVLQLPKAPTLALADSCDVAGAGEVVVGWGWYVDGTTPGTGCEANGQCSTPVE